MRKIPEKPTKSSILKYICEYNCPFSVPCDGRQKCIVYDDISKMLDRLIDSAYDSGVVDVSCELPTGTTAKALKIISIDDWKAEAKQ